MIALLLAQLAARWGQAVTLAVVSLAATAAAVAAPAYATVAARAAAADEVAAAEPAELVVSLPFLAPVEAARPDVDEYRGAVAALADFQPVTTVTITVQGLDSADESELHRLFGRDDFCRYVVFRAGRCPVGSREVAVPAVLAEAVGRRVGEQLVLTPTVQTDLGYQPDGPPVPLTLVGVFDASDPADPYWATLDPLGSRGATPAIFTNRGLIRTMQHNFELAQVDAIVPPAALTPERVPALRQQLERAERQLEFDTATGGVPTLNTSLPELLDRITGHGERARALLPIAVAPLLALCWLVVYLAVGHGVAGRRPEVGTVALRGTKPWRRAVAVAAESLLPVLVGAPVGVAAALGLAALAGEAGGLGTAELAAAGVAIAGSVVAVLMALQRELVAPVAQLLRRVPPRRRRAAVAAGEVLVVALAVWAVVELRGLGGELVGVMVAAPAVVMLAVAAVAARAARPVIDLAGRRSLRRGRLAPALAALRLARQPGTLRLLLVLALALGTVGFAITAAEVAARGRTAEAARLLGAARVLDIRQADRGELLRAVRNADPSGRYAMAVVSTPESTDEPPTVAVDATRLASVARWSDRYGGAGAAEIAALLRPSAPEPVLVGDGELTAELSIDVFTADRAATLSALLAPPAGEPVVAGFGPLRDERREYRTEVTGCADGCRLAGLAVATTEEGDSDVFGGIGIRVGVIVHGLRQGGGEVLSDEWLNPDRWRPPGRGLPTEHAAAEPDPGGLVVTKREPVPGQAYQVLIVDVPYPLPVVAAGELGEDDLLTGVDGEPIQVAPRASLAGLPGVGATGLLMDLEYAERLTARPGVAVSPQVWLTADAPAGIVDRLREQGLVISGDRTVGSVQQRLDRSGGARALGFYLAAAGAAALVGMVALGLVAAVDRRAWSPGLRALRAQGVPERTTAAAAIWSYGGVVLAGAVAGALAAAGAWLAAGERMPFGLDRSVLTDWPEWTGVVAGWAVVAGLLLLVAVASAIWQRSSARAREVDG